MDACLNWFLWGVSNQSTPFGDAPSPVLDPLDVRVSSAASVLAVTVTAEPSFFLPKEQIGCFVTNAPLFAYVSEKDHVIEGLVATSKKLSTPRKLSNLVELLNRGPMTIKDPVFRDADFADLVVLAHVSEKITILQLATVFYWKSALEHHRDKEIIEIPLFLENGQVNPDAKTIMMETVLANKELKKKPDVEHWFRRMKKEPASERMFLCTKVGNKGLQFLQSLTRKGRSYSQKAQEIMTLVGDAFQTENTPTILDAVRFHSKPHFFHRITHQKRDCQMFASVSMANQMFEFIGKQAAMVPRFGVSDSLRENGIRHERDVALQSPYASLPNRADGFLAPYDEFTAHDFIYHAFLVNGIPKEHQTLFITLADKIREIDPKLAGMIEDMESALYVVEKKGNPEEIFMQYLLHVANGIVGIKQTDVFREIAQDPSKNPKKKLEEITSRLIENRSLKKEKEDEKAAVFRLLVRSLIHILKNTVEKTPFKQVLLEYLKQDRSNR